MKQHIFKEKIMKTTNFTTKIAMATVAALCLASATGAYADDAMANVPTRTVHYADLNLNTQAGAAVLYKRIRVAAAQVCGDVNSRRLDEAAAAQACVDHAVNASVQSVNNAKLTNEYNARTGGAQKLINVASLR
jgi:UrcA family protein